MAAPMMDVISRYLWMLDVLTSQGKIDVVLVHDQVDVEGEGAGLPLDPDPGSVDASLHPDPDLVTASVDQAPEEGTSQHPAAAVGLKQHIAAAVRVKHHLEASRPVARQAVLITYY